MKIGTTPLISSLVVTLAAVAASSSLCGAALYTETFDNNAGSNQLISTIGWDAYYGTTAQTIANASSGNRLAIANLNGNPSADGKAYFYAANTTQDMIWVGYEDGLSLSGVTDFTWNMGNSTTAAEVKLIIQVDGAWYASVASFSNSSTYSGGTFSSAGASADVVQELTYSTTASNWLDLTIDAGNTLAIGSIASSDLSASPITGIGFYVDSQNTLTTVRIDTLSAIPEPVAFSLLSGCMVMFTLFMRRRGK